MRKLLVLVIVLFMASGALFANAEQEAGSAWSLDKNVEWVVTSSAGGGSSIFTQNIVEIIKSEGLVDQNIIINYKTDGGGAIGRRAVGIAKTNGHTTYF